MKPSPNHSSLPWLVAVAGVITLLSPRAVYAQADPTTSDAQKPYIMILMDTSGSMEWTDEGDEEYPRAANPGGDQEWQSGKPLTPANNRYGPCYIWNPSCAEYERPAWTPDASWTAAYGSTMQGQLDRMRSDGSPRLNNDSQPRHVTVKEILTGEMVMYHDSNADKSLSDLDPSTSGPACWFVPRQYSTSTQSDQVCSAPDDAKFKKFPDYDEPKPHFQEVFDGQLPNGLMDTVAGNAIFGVAMFDGYKDSYEPPETEWDIGGGGPEDLNDPMAPSFGGIIEGRGDPTKSPSGPNGSGDPDKANYDLGVYQILSPQNLDLSTSLAGQISDYVQYALIDAGYLRTNDDKRLDPGGHRNRLGGLGLGASRLLGRFIDSYTLGRQPVARATPLAAAMYDIQQYFAHGKAGGTRDHSPITDDPYMTCRPKHVIMMTDGYPEPESSGPGKGIEVGGETINAAFGYEKDRYPYTYTEKAIERFVNDLDADNTLAGGDSYLTDSWTSDRGIRFNPKVHVVGLQVGEPGDGINEDLEKKAILKLALMAKEGKTCAGQYLDKLKPSGYCSSPPCCDPSTEVCLDERQADVLAGTGVAYSGTSYSVPTPGTSPDPECNFPALILTTNDRDKLAEVLQTLFNSILSNGVASQTRPTFVNHLDDNPADPKQGQYRVYSGVDVSAESPFWKGLLFREQLVCGANSTGAPTVKDNEYLAMHDEIEALAGDVDDKGNVTNDKRRIFTAFADDDAYDYATNLPRSLDDADGGAMDRNRFIFGFDLATSGKSGADEFGDTYLGAAPQRLVDTRIPFEISTMSEPLDDLSQTPVDYFQVASTRNAASRTTRLERLVNEVRGRSESKDGRALGAILNSSPVAVEPPSLDLPIDSYRAYKSLQADRPSMLYFATTDGLLHAVYSGELKGTDSSRPDQVMTRTATDPSSAGTGGNEIAGSMHDQREAWAYLPQILHKDLASFQSKQPNLMDGTPVVKDVRLCHTARKYNQNKQACRYKATCTSDDDCRAQAANNQWRTVLVEGLGQAGAGYFAMDITRPGGRHFASDETKGIQTPDPAPLWEFDSNWERGQVKKLSINHKDLVYPQDESLRKETSFITEAAEKKGEAKPYFWDLPFLGRSVGEAAIGTVAIRATFSTTTDSARLRRPVAVFSGGASGPFGPDYDRDQRIGRAIYVVDLQTGTLLRRFVSYNDIYDNPGQETRFKSTIVGSPALYNSFPGSLVTRGFVGDKQGRLYRIDLSSDNPANWSVSMFFDPAESADIAGTGPFGPASYKPALALGTGATDHSLLVFYGLGERGDLSASGKEQLMIGLQEDVSVDFSTTPGTGKSTATAKYLWHAAFEEADTDKSGRVTGGRTEKLTGAPVVFNKNVYFTTFVEPAANRCSPGWSRIYGLKYEGKMDGTGSSATLKYQAEGAIEQTADEEGKTSTGQGENAQASDTSSWYYQPKAAPDVDQKVVVRGLTVTLGPVCAADPAESGGGMQGGADRKPTLVAQTSSDGALPGDRVQGPSGGAALSSIEHKLPRPESQNIPLSWSVISH